MCSVREPSRRKSNAIRRCTLKKRNKYFEMAGTGALPAGGPDLEALVSRQQGLQVGRQVSTSDVGRAHWPNSTSTGAGSCTLVASCAACLM